jgi:DNA polymerase III gamma/tau subunit
MDQLSPNIAWYEKYRPKSIDDVVFSNQEDKNLIATWVANERIPGNVLFSGPAGTGKTTISLILIRNLIKSQNDLCRMRSRKVEEIDDKVAPFITKKPVASKSKIVYIEELDGLSRQAQRQLKEDMLEKFQEHVSFICCTNYPKRIDGALLTRFTYKIDFSSDNIVDIKRRLEYVLDEEKATYDKEELSNFVDKNYRHGLRELINSLQKVYVSNNGNINFQDLEKNLNIEDNIVTLIFKMIETVMKNNEPTTRRLCIITPINSIIGKEYQEFVTLCHNNYDINYENVFVRLYETTRFIPLQVIVAKYSEEIEMKKYPHAHLISAFYEMIKCVIESML